MKEYIYTVWGKEVFFNKTQKSQTLKENIDKFPCLEVYNFVHQMTQ